MIFFLKTKFESEINIILVILRGNNTTSILFSRSYVCYCVIKKHNNMMYQA